MVRVFLSAVLTAALFPAVMAAQSNPFVGRWDFDVPTRNGIGANWLGISEQNGTLDIWFQPTGGNVYQIKDYKQDGPHLTMTVAPQTGARLADHIWAPSTVPNGDQQCAGPNRYSDRGSGRLPAAFRLHDSGSRQRHFGSLGVMEQVQSSEQRFRLDSRAYWNPERCSG
jgi:hypothetical protein